MSRIEKEFLAEECGIDPDAALCNDTFSSLRPIREAFYSVYDPDSGRFLSSTLNSHSEEECRERLLGFIFGTCEENEDEKAIREESLGNLCEMYGFEPLEHILEKHEDDLDLGY